MSFRYYLYVSDAKVDMLLSQIDPGYQRRRAAEFSVNLTVVGVKRSTENPGTDRVARLERVARYLDEHADVGSVEEPGQFFRGLLPMRWGIVPTTDEQSLVYFGGRTEDTIVGLGGSPFHVLGAAPPTDPARVRRVVHDARAARRPRRRRGRTGAGHPGRRGRRGGGGGAGVGAPGRHPPAGAHAEREFLAKRLLSGPSPYPELDGRPGMTVLLGSPLYVALVD